jgi:hypothetical protein
LRHNNIWCQVSSDKDIPLGDIAYQPTTFEVTGTVRCQDLQNQETSRSRLAGITISLLDDAGAEIDQAITDDKGAFTCYSAGNGVRALRFPGVWRDGNGGVMALALESADVAVHVSDPITALMPVPYRRIGLFAEADAPAPAPPLREVRRAARDQDDNPIPNIWVELRDKPGSNGKLFGGVVTGSEGEFELHAVTEATELYLLYYAGPDWQSAVIHTETVRFDSNEQKEE